MRFRSADMTTLGTPAVSVHHVGLVIQGAAGRVFDLTNAAVQVRVSSVGMAGRRNRVCTASQMTGEMRFRSADMATLGTPACPLTTSAL
jgi:hypothetical protein